VIDPGTIDELSDNLARVVDTVCHCPIDTERILKRGIATCTVEKAEINVCATATALTDISSNNLARIVDIEGSGVQA
jgi:hypothetical protein